MNLVQINERLKDLPMQVLQQYANGMNPEVPPYLALGELQRREIAQKQMATAQGGQQGPQPSVKEQVEQKAGLMALQQMQQQQLAQQMQQPRGPMPAPAGVPQPEAQPEVMMARGGLAGIPVRRDMFEYAGGGIIAFQAGGQPKYETRYDKMNRENREQAAKDEPRVINVPPGTPAQEVEMIRLQNPDAIVRTGEEGSKIQALLDKIKSAATYSSDVEAMKQRERVASAPSGSVSEAQASAMAGPKAQVPAGLPAALPAALSAAAGPAGTKPPAPPVAQPPAAMPPAAQAGLPAALAGTPAAASIPVAPDRAELEALMKSQKRQAPTAQGIIGDVNALMPEGMQEEAMKRRFAEQRARAEARQAAYEQSKPSGLDDLIRVFGQAGQYKGLSGLAPAYTANQQQRRAEDLAMQKQQDELMTAIEGREYGADKEVFTARTGAMDKAQTLFGQSEKSILDAAAKKLEAEQGRLDKQAQLNMQLDLKKFEMAQEERLKGMDIEQRERERKTTAANNPAARAAQFVALKQQARDLRAKGEIAKADRLDAQASDMLAFSGGASVDRNPTPTDRLRAAQSILTDIDSTPEEKAMAKREIAGIMSGGKAAAPAKPITKAEYDKLPKGATYTAPDGSQRTKG